MAGYRSMRREGFLLVLLLGALAGCGYKGPSLAGYEGLGYQVTSYYERFAIEKGATCNSPEMSIASSRVVEDTPDRIVLSVKYFWQDTSNAIEDSFTGGIRTFGVGSCTGWDERLFTVSKFTGGGTQVVDMSGARRDR